MKQKLIVLVETKNGAYEAMAKAVSDKKTQLVDTEDCDAPEEYHNIYSAIEEFSQSDKEIMLVKISGNESVVRELGDERPEMLVTLSDNVNNKLWYTEKPVNMFLQLLTIFK